MAGLSSLLAPSSITKRETNTDRFRRRLSPLVLVVLYDPSNARAARQVLPVPKTSAFMCDTSATAGYCAQVLAGGGYSYDNTVPYPSGSTFHRPRTSDSSGFISALCYFGNSNVESADTDFTCASARSELCCTASAMSCTTGEKHWDVQLAGYLRSHLSDLRILRGRGRRGFFLCHGVELVFLFVTWVLVASCALAWTIRSPGIHISVYSIPIYVP